MNFSSTVEEGRHKAEVKLAQDMYLKYYRLLLEKGELPPHLSSLSRLKSEIEMLESSREEKDVKIWMLTINPPNPYDWSHLIPVVDKILSYKRCIIDPSVQLEQRSDDEDFPHGYHVHIACKLGKSSSNIIDDVYRALVKHIPDATKNCVDLKRSPSAYEYVAGEKKLEKLEKCRVDEILRNNFFVDHIKPEWLTRKDCSLDMQKQECMEAQ